VEEGPTGLPNEDEADAVIAPVPADEVEGTAEFVELIEVMPCAMSEVGRSACWLYMDELEGPPLAYEKVSVSSSVVQLVEVDPTMPAAVEEAGDGMQFSWKPTKPGRLDHDSQYGVVVCDGEAPLEVMVSRLIVGKVVGGIGTTVSVWGSKVWVTVTVTGTGQAHPEDVGGVPAAYIVRVTAGGPVYEFTSETF
jgi:hypothetical protein